MFLARCGTATFIHSAVAVSSLRPVAGNIMPMDSVVGSSLATTSKGSWEARKSSGEDLVAMLLSTKAPEFGDSSTGRVSE